MARSVIDDRYQDGRRLYVGFELNGTMFEESRRLDRLKSTPGYALDPHKPPHHGKDGKEGKRKRAVSDESESSSGDESGSESESEFESESGYDSRSKERGSTGRNRVLTAVGARRKFTREIQTRRVKVQKKKDRSSRKSRRKQSKHKKTKSSSGRTGDKKRSKNHSDTKKRQRKIESEVDDKTVELKEFFDSQKKSAVEELEKSPLIGPMPLPKAPVVPADRGWDRALRPGEGEAIAQFVQQGKRIPRRGEVGLTAEEITNYEKAGYVMSGNRHKKMTAVRMRKENQVYSAEDKRALAMFNFEERAKKEQQVMASLRRLIQQHTGECDD